MDEIETVEEFVSPFQSLLTDLNQESTLNKSITNLKRKLENLRSQNTNKKGKNAGKKPKSVLDVVEDNSENGDDSEASDVDLEDKVDSEESEEDEIEIDESGINTYAQEVLCKDNTESEEKIALGKASVWISGY